MTGESELSRDDERNATLYKTTESVNTSRAIADAKAKYEDEYDVPKYELTARKFESGYDREDNTSYKVIAVAVRHDAPDEVYDN